MSLFVRAISRAPNVLPCGVWINFAARERGELIANIHHGVTAFALEIVDPNRAKLKSIVLTSDARPAVNVAGGKPRLDYRLAIRYLVALRMKSKGKT
jgi:hypothetical protein